MPSEDQQGFKLLLVERNTMAVKIALKKDCETLLLYKSPGASSLRRDADESRAVA
jgi:hypothetical protein